MTSDPAAPGAPAVYLLRELTADDGPQMRILYARIKILTEAGRARFSDVVIPYEDKEEKIKGVEARTIHSDGAVIPFTGKPWQKEVLKAGGVRYMEKGFSMPDVQVGSILEYRYETTYDGWWAPRWYLQQPVPVHRLHYHFNPGPGGVAAATLFLPPAAQINQKRGWDLSMENVPAMAEEDDSPPMSSLGYHVLFYYTTALIDTPEKYWKWEGGIWSKGVDEYAVPGKLKNVVAQVVLPGDTDEQKLRKIYAAVMKIENLDFSREHSDKEAKAEHLKFGNAADIWRQQRGYSREITMVFLGLVRAAGFKAYAIFVTNRDANVFLRQQLDWDQLDDELVIVNLGGKEMLFDPGERYCEFGQQHWKHTWSMGIRQTDKGTEFAETPFPIYTGTAEHRVAYLKMDANNAVHGSIRITMTGSIALRWRHEALLNDEEEAKKVFEDDLEKQMPEGVTVRLTELTGLTDSTQPVVARLEVSGTLGSKQGRRMFLPGTFFEAKAKPRFVTATRKNPVYLHYGYTVDDNFTLSLPPDVQLEALPTNANVSLPHDADFIERYGVRNGTYQYGRLERVSTILYQTKDYPAVCDFFQQMNTQDQAPLVLKLAPAADQAGTTAK